MEQVQKWEHKIARESDWSKLLKSEIDYLDHMGNEGWELCHVNTPRSILGENRYYWRKPIQDNSTQEVKG